MRTIGDKILDMAMDESNLNSTDNGIKLLQLDPNDYHNNIAGNYFIAALSIIRRQQKQIDDLKNALKNLICCSVFNGQVFENDKETHKMDYCKIRIRKNQRIHKIRKVIL